MVVTSELYPRRALRDLLSQSVDRAEAFVRASQKNTQPSELIVPLAKAAATFFVQMFSEENGSRVSSSAAAMQILFGVGERR
jgi:hypothetical protein